MSGAHGPVEEPAVALSVELGEWGFGDSALGDEEDVGVPTRRVCESSEVRDWEERLGRRAVGEGERWW